MSELAAAADGIEDEDLIEREDMVVTVTMGGYIKRTPARRSSASRSAAARAAPAWRPRKRMRSPTLFVTSTHNPVLFFSNLGRVYRMKVWKLPEGGPNTSGRPMVNLLPLAEGETISTVLPLPEDEAEWGKLHIMFATAHGTVRRNSMAAFTNIPTAGKIAMRFGMGAAEDVESSDDSDEQADPSDRLIGVELLTEGDDVLLATRHGKAIRFKATDVREFQSRTSTGVRGVRLQAGDEVISMSILHRVGTTQEEREAYLRFAPWKGEKDGECSLSPERIAELDEKEQFILTVTENGYGKRSSRLRISPHQSRRPGHHQHRYVRPQRLRRRQLPGAPGRAADAGHRPGQDDPHHRRRHPHRWAATRMGVTIFRVAEDEHVVSVAKIEESDEEEIEIEGGDEFAPVDDAVVGESELDKPADPEPK